MLHDALLYDLHLISWIRLLIYILGWYSLSELIFKTVLSTILRNHESEVRISLLKHYLRQSWNKNGLWIPSLDVSNLYIYKCIKSIYIHYLVQSELFYNLKNVLRSLFKKCNLLLMFI